MILFLLLRASIFGFHFRIDAEPQLTLCDSASGRDIAQELGTKASGIW
jgi:hypothetical protein